VLLGNLYIDVTDPVFENPGRVTQLLDGSQSDGLADGGIPGVNPDFHRIPPMLVLASPGLTQIPTMRLVTSARQSP
jgi:hypothetical protein